MKPYNHALREEHGQIETEYLPLYHLDTQYTHYVDTLKRVGCIYLQVFIDTHTGTVFNVKLYDRKNALAEADLFIDRVLSFFEEGRTAPELLTDRGPVYCGFIEHHKYQL